MVKLEETQFPMDSGGAKPNRAVIAPSNASGEWPASAAAPEPANDALCLSVPDSNSSGSELFFHELGEQRLRALELLAAQATEIDRVELGLAAQLHELSTELEASRQTAIAERAAAESGAAALANQAAELARLKSELARSQAACEEAQHANLNRQTQAVQLLAREEQLEQRARELQSSEAGLRQAQRVQTINEEEIQSEKEHLARLRKRLEDQTLRLEAEREAIAAEQEKTKSQRRRIARELKEQRADQIEAFNRRKAELQSLASRRQGDSAVALEAAQAEAAELRLQDSHLRKLLNERGTELHQQRDENQQLHAANREQARQLDRMRTEVDRLRETSTQQDVLAGDDQQQLSRLRAESDQLRARLVEAEERLSRADNEAEQAKREDLQRRFELAVGEVRDLKRKNADLEDKLAGGGGSAARPIAKDTGRLDWESQKRRLLESLENEEDEDEDDRETRLTIEGTIRITDAVVAQKDQEIAELKQLLDHQSANLGSMAVGATAIAELFNNDELIEQQRERLRVLEKEWEAKLRTAEIDISLERAKIARDRAELEEKLESERSRPAAGTAEGDGGKPNRNRWLTRLGLKDQPE
jgi:hypothetical protein